jgi:hypothetical protein
LGSRSGRRNRLLYVHGSLHSAFSVYLTEVLLFFCSSYRQLRVAAQCRAYKGHFRSSRCFLSTSQPTQPPGPQLPPRKTPRVSICIACVLAMRIEVGQDTDAANRWHECHQNPENRVEMEYVHESQARFLPTGTTLAERGKICSPPVHHVQVSRLLLPNL